MVPSHGVFYSVSLEADEEEEKKIQRGGLRRLKQREEPRPPHPFRTQRNPSTQRNAARAADDMKTAPCNAGAGAKADAASARGRRCASTPCTSNQRPGPPRGGRFGLVRQGRGKVAVPTRRHENRCDQEASLPSLLLRAATSEEVVVSGGNGAEDPAKKLSNGNGAALENGNGAVADLDPCDAGQLEACAQTAPRVTKVVEGSQGKVVEETIASTIDESQAGLNKPEDRWSRLKNTSTWRRTVEIWSFVFVFFFKLWVVNSKWSYAKADRDKSAKRGINAEARAARTEELACWLRERLVTLGPTFIKIGQQFSTRSDILSPEFIAELVKLQDRVPAFSSELALATVEKELGVTSWKEKFSYLEAEPIAAARSVPPPPPATTSLSCSSSHLPTPTHVRLSLLLTLI